MIEWELVMVMVMGQANEAKVRRIGLKLRFSFGQLLRFGWQQALSCVFPAIIMLGLAVTKWTGIPGLYDYDVLLLICVAGQIGMIAAKLESWDELKVICVFHIVGLGLEWFKVSHGSWSYPQDAWTKLWGVPLYSGFMYASVASYLCQAWRRLGVEVHRWPPGYLVVPLGAMVYGNFFAHHYMVDLRWFIAAALFAVFSTSSVSYEVGGRRYRMPMIGSFLLIGLFIYFAENIVTFLGAWQYPNQRRGWSPVGFGKLSSWCLLVIVSFMMVAQLKRVKYGPAAPVSETEQSLKM